MGEMSEVFNAMKEHRKTVRRENIEMADSEFDIFVEAASIGGYSIMKMSSYHWNVYRDGRCVVQYWPSANKWQVAQGGKIQHGDRESFRNRLKSGRF